MIFTKIENSLLGRSPTLKIDWKRDQNDIIYFALLFILRVIQLKNAKFLFNITKN